MENISIGNNTTREGDSYYYYDYVDVCDGSESYWQRKAYNIIQLYVYPIVIIGGALCNLLAIIVLQTRSYRGTSTGFLMTALALADWGLLLSGFLRLWILALTKQELDLRLLSDVGCKFNVFFSYFFLYMSAWTLALITIERVICVCSPFKCKELCSLKRIVIGWVVIFIIMLAISLHFFWSYHVEYYPFLKIFDCGAVEKFDRFLYGGAFDWIDITFAAILPFVIITGGNITISVKLVARHFRRKNMTATSKSSRTSSTTVMLLTISIAFLLTITPYSIYSMGFVYEHWSYKNAYECAKLDLAFGICHLMFNLNSAINFLLYCASGLKFRKAFLSFICFKKCETSDNISATNTSHINNEVGRKTASVEAKEFFSIVQFSAQNSNVQNKNQRVIGIDNCAHRDDFGESHYEESTTTKM